MKKLFIMEETLIIDNCDRPVLWTNGIPEILDNNTNNIGCVNCIYVTKNGDVYAAGEVNDENRQYKGVVWKNGKKLDYDFKITHINSIYVTESGRIYLGGYDDDYHAGVWIDGSYKKYADVESYINSVWVTKYNQFYAGGSLDGTQCLWKDYKIQSEYNVNGGEIVSVCESDNGDLYVAGYEYYNNDRPDAVLWINGIKSKYEDFWCSSFSVSGNNWCMGGWNKNKNPIVLKNGKQIIPADMRDINCYVQSVYMTKNGDVYASIPCNNQPTVLIDGKLEQLDGGKGFVKSIFVKE